MITPETQIPLGLTFDDVLLVPQRTSARSRKEVDVSTKVTKGIDIKTPVISANTPWCTEAAMAIAMAKQGGIGIIHRMTTMEIQAALVEKVKSAVIDRAIFPKASVDANNLPLVGAAIGTKDDYLERAKQLIDKGVDILVVDIAHGHADYALDTISKLKALYPQIDLIGGNVATAEAVADFIAAGADAVKVGIGPGGVCTTRLVAGAGVPQLTAIIECVNEARKQGIPIIADGGIRTSGDIAKAIAAGASTVMLGSMLAGTDESAAQLMEIDGNLYKISTGFPSLGVELTLKRIRNEEITDKEVKEYVPEGVDATFEYKGSVADVLTQLVGGLRSGMSYSGSLSIAEFWEKARFIRVTPAGQAENKPHIQTKTTQIHPNYRSLVAQKSSGQNSFD
ncbi:IMP dehydrogenase [Aerosakkonemataceae cyanobacterium BLCC-F154]|uniref:IMP dehydrogenase n=1 Tax=Floridaenema fluviatile BLCC-F154 TaxID=3153640 RepID=A0ABV4YJG2_9CYAN